MKEYLPIIEKSALFDGIESTDLMGLIGCLGAWVTEMKKGQPILREGDSTSLIGVILTGSVQMVREDFYGNRSVVAHIGPTQLFGESYAFSGAQSLPVSIVPEKDGHVLMIEGRRITSCCSNACHFHNRLIYNLLGLVANKNLLLHQKIEVTSKRTTREKLMTYLLSQAKLQNSSSFTIPFERQALADYLEVDRSGLSAEISKMRKEGILESEKSHFRLLTCQTEESRIQ